METIERGNQIESKKNIENIRIPIDERFVFTVRTKPVTHSSYYGKGAAPEVEIVIEDLGNGKTVVDLNRLLMENSKSGRGVSFVLGSEWSSSHLFRSVEISQDELSNPREIFGVLHELGHRIVGDEYTEEYMEEFRQMRARIRESKHPTPQDLQRVLQNERDSWARAIRLARTIKSDYGVDLFKAFKNADEFMGWLRQTGLRTYEEALEEIGIKAYTKDEKVRVWQHLADSKLVSAEDFDSYK